MAGRKVMIIDDDADFLEELKETLDQTGYKVIKVNDPSAALTVAGSVRPEVILMDIKMPGINGFQLAHAIKHFWELHQIPIIAMTGYLKDNHDDLMAICGIKKCLKKPFMPLDMISEIEKACHDNDIAA